MPHPCHLFTHYLIKSTKSKILDGRMYTMQLRNLVQYILVSARLQHSGFRIAKVCMLPFHKRVLASLSFPWAERSVPAWLPFP